MLMESQMLIEERFLEDVSNPDQAEDKRNSLWTRLLLTFRFLFHEESIEDWNENIKLMNPLSR